MNQAGLPYPSFALKFRACQPNEINMFAQKWWFSVDGGDWKSSWDENVVYAHSKYKHILVNSKTNKHSNVGCK